MEARSLSEVVKHVLGGDRSIRGSIFVACLTGEEILVITNRKPQSRLPSPSYANIFILTICGNCVGSPGSERGAVGSFELDKALIHNSDAFVAARNCCDGEINYMRQVEPREAIMRECQRYGVRIQSARLLEGGSTPKWLDVLPDYDPGFM